MLTLSIRDQIVFHLAMVRDRGTRLQRGDKSRVDFFRFLSDLFDSDQTSIFLASLRRRVKQRRFKVKAPAVS